MNVCSVRGSCMQKEMLNVQVYRMKIFHALENLCFVADPLEGAVGLEVPPCFLWARGSGWIIYRHGGVYLMWVLQKRDTIGPIREKNKW